MNESNYSLQELSTIADTIHKTELVPASYRGRPDAVLAAVLTGQELGLPPMTSLRHIYIVDGRPALSAEAMISLVRSHGHSIVGEVEDGVARVTGTRRDNGDTITVLWTPKDTDRAELAKRKNWQRYPDSMAWARATSSLCRRLFPDILSGVSYTPDELDTSSTTTDVIELDRPANLVPVDEIDDILETHDDEQCSIDTTNNDDVDDDDPIDFEGYADRARRRHMIKSVELALEQYPGPIVEQRLKEIYGKDNVAALDDRDLEDILVKLSDRA